MSTSESVLDTFTGWAAMAAGEPLQRHEFSPGPLGAEDVEVAVEYCGICHSDQSMIDNEWGNARYPFVPGHEVVGTVVRLGEQTRGLKLGQRVGIGWYKGSCMHCSSCMEGSHQLCRTVKPTIVGSNGGFANRVRAHWAWAIALPDSLDPSLAGPLFCAGSTVFSPLLEFGVKPTDRVGVVGIGGLGHMGIKLAHAMGAHVVAFTTSESKRNAARALGADDVVVSRNEDEMAAHVKSFDFILNTVAAPHNLDAFTTLLKRDGTMTLVGAPATPHPSPEVFNLIFRRRSIAGSMIGGIPETQEMLDFCAEHGIVADIELIRGDEINEAWERMVKGDVKYRFVIDSATLAG